MRISDWSSDVCSSDLIERGQKIAYVTDVGDTAANRSAIQALANDADTFFIEASFSAADRQQAAQRAHLTTTAAGEIARSANARRVEPFHFSPRYRSEEHTSELQSLMRISYAVFCLKKTKQASTYTTFTIQTIT